MISFYDLSGGVVHPDMESNTVGVKSGVAIARHFSVGAGAA